MSIINKSKILRIALLLTPFFLISKLYAQSWEFIAISEKEERYYIDPSSIIKNGSTVKFTQLSNHPKGFQYDSYLAFSIVTFRTADCEKNSYKSGHLFAYPELNALGGIGVVDLKHDIRWIGVKPNSMAFYMQQRVCEKIVL